MEAMTLGAAIDQLYSLQNERKEYQRLVDERLLEFSSQEREIEQHVLAILQKDGMSGAKGTRAQVNIKPRSIPRVVDWQALFAHIKETNSFDLLQKRIGATAWKDRVENGESVPGVEAETFSALSITKLA